MAEHTHTTVLQLSGFCPGQPRWAGTRLTHSHLSWLPIVPYLLPPSIMIHGILSVQFTCLTVFFHNLTPSFLWSTSWSGTLHFIFHTFLHPIIIFFSQHMPVPSQPVLLYYRDYVINPSLEILSCSIMPHIHLTILASARWSATSYSFLWARSHFHATYCFAHNCCTISLSLSMVYPYW